MYLLTWKIAPAIAVGNTVVAKPSEMTSLTAWMLCQLFEKAGLPKGVVNMVFGRGKHALREEKFGNVRLDHFFQVPPLALLW